MDAATAILERLDRIERQLALLSRTPVAAPPARMRPAQAAAALGCSTRMVSRYAARGLLVRLPKPAGAGRNAATYFDPANVAALVRSEDAARGWVAKRKYVPSGNRR